MPGSHRVLLRVLRRRRLLLILCLRLRRVLGRSGRRCVCSCGLRPVGRRRRRSGRLTVARSGCGIAVSRRSGCRGRGAGWRRLNICQIVALQLVEDRRHFKRHLVAGIHGRVALGVQHVHLVVPRIGLQPASQRQGGRLRQVVPVELGRHVLQVAPSTACRRPSAASRPAWACSAPSAPWPRSANCS